MLVVANGSAWAVRDARWRSGDDRADRARGLRVATPTMPIYDMRTMERDGQRSTVAGDGSAPMLLALFAATRADRSPSIGIYGVRHC